MKNFAIGFPTLHQKRDDELKCRILLPWRHTWLRSEVGDLTSGTRSCDSCHAAKADYPLTNKAIKHFKAKADV